MKKSIITLSFLLQIILLNAQAPAFQWARQFGGTSNELSYGVAVDASGNVYTTGMFNGTCDFDPSAATYNLTSAGLTDIFISKLDASGNFVWAKKLGGKLSDYGYGLALDKSGNVYITGSFQDTVDFDPAVTGVSDLIAASAFSDIFIVKLNSDGNFVWAKSIGGVMADVGFSIAVNESADVFTTGVFNGTVDFNPGAGIFNLISAGATETFISKLDSNGNFVWAKNIGGPMNDKGTSIALDKNGNVFTTGYFQGTADFDPSAASFNLVSSGIDDIFILKLDANGNFVWAKGMGSSLSDGGNALVLDLSGNVYVTGGFFGTVDFDPGAGISNLIAVGSIDIFVLKLDASGNFVWAKSMGSTGGDAGYAIALDLSGNVFTSGTFQNTGDFDPGAGVFNLTANGSNEIFISKLDPSANFIWAGSIGGIASDITYSMVVNSAGSIYATGNFYGVVDFDPTPGIFNLTGPGGNDVFVMKMGSSGFGINNQSNIDNFNIYPNPNNGIFNIALSGKSNERVEIFNSLGALIYTQPTLTGQNSIDLTNQPDGLYFIKVFDNENKIATGRIVKTD